MSLFHAVVRIDHQSADHLRFDAEHVAVARRSRPHTHTAYHGGAGAHRALNSSARCYATRSEAPEVLVTGSHSSTTDQHRRQAPRRAGQAGRRLQDGRSRADRAGGAGPQIYHSKYDRMGTPTPPDPIVRRLQAAAASSARWRSSPPDGPHAAAAHDNTELFPLQTLQIQRARPGRRGSCPRGHDCGLVRAGPRVLPVHHLGHALSAAWRGLPSGRCC